MSTVMELFAAGPMVQLAGEASPVTWADTVVAVSLAVLAVVGVAGAIVGLVYARSLGRILRSLERTARQLEPLARPVLDRAGRVAEDAAEITHGVRRNVEDVNETVDGLHQRLRRTIEEAERRVRRFAAVLDVVQEEAEEVLMDATATARGMHATSERIRRPRGRGAGRSDEDRE